MGRGAGNRGPLGSSSSPGTDPPAALGWLIGAIVAAAFVVVFALLAITGRVGFAWPGLIAVMLLIWLAQQQFTETHRRRYHRWPGGWQFFWTGSQERRDVGQAWTRKDADRTVELSRILGFGLLILSVVAAFVLLAVPG